MNIKYTHKRSKRAKRLRLAIYCDGRVVLTTPFRVNQSIVEQFIADKKQWVLDKLNLFENIDTKSIRVFSHKDYLENKDKALEVVNERIEHYNKTYGFTFNKIFIKNQKTRWGSCSRKKNLNLNYKILFLTQEQRDYIIVHELCHLREFNHSKNFWALVEKALPNYMEIKRALRKQEGICYT